MGQDEIAYVPELILHLFSWIGRFKMKFCSFQMIIEVFFFFFFIICLQESKRFEGFIFQSIDGKKIWEYVLTSVLFLFSRLTGN